MQPRPTSFLSLSWCVLTLAVTCCKCEISTVASAAETMNSVEAEFQTLLLPWLQQYCGDCHDHESPAAQLDLLQFTTIDTVRLRHQAWSEVRRRIEAREMPPADADQPSDAERKAVLSWMERFRVQEIERTGDDPGPNLARRLNSAEYNNTIRDLTGFDLSPAREFPVDPANEAGFDNSAQSLTMSPALLEKYLAAAQRVADHLVFTPTELRFAPHPVVTDSDRDKYCVERIIEFYRRHEVQLANYLVATRDIGRQLASIPLDTAAFRIAQDHQLSGKYLRSLYEFLASEAPAAGVTADVRQRWRTLIEKDATDSELRTGCRELAELLQQWRTQLSPTIDVPQVRGISSGSQAFVLWKNRQEAKWRRTWQGESATAIETSATREFCAVIPDAFVVTERGMNKGRPLSAGFHLMVGYFRDDAPLYELILTDAEQKELDTLWAELDFITRAPIRQYKDYVFFERAEPPRFMFDAQFDFARSEDHDVSSEAKIARLAELYLAKAEQAGASELALTAIKDYYDRMSAQIRWIEQAHAAAEPRHLASLVALAERIYRRPLTAAEPDELRDFYHRIREEHQLSHEDAIRMTLVSMLASPYFCYHYPLGDASSPSRSGVATTMSPSTLANRLSYFLWASMPDATLTELAAARSLNHPTVLSAQVDRMCEDTRSFGFALEFCGNWLDFRRFEEHNSVDRQRFPEFNDELRQAMFAEPVVFFQDLLRRDGSVLELLYGSHTFVNETLAKHYEIDLDSARVEPLPQNRVPTSVNDQPWYRVADATDVGRGGLLPMAVFLTKNSPGLRTSPVKRGYWVVRRLLGASIPPPPPNVPELPANEADAGDQSLPALLAQHRNNPNCAACHERFDSFGLAFEGFGPIGERRTLDLGDRPVEMAPAYPDGTVRNGVVGLRDYLRLDREDEFVDNLCRKMFAYAIGRELLLSDEKSLQRAKSELTANNYQIRSLIRAIVTSPQFLQLRSSVPQPPEN